MPSFPTILQTPPGQEASAADFINYVSLGVVGHDPEDPSLAFVRVVNGQVLVEVELSGDGDEVDAYLCHSQTGASAGDYIPVAAGDSVVLVWPDGQSASPYIIARLADVERQLAGSCCGIDTTASDRVRQFRWLRTPEGQIYAVQSGGELLLQGGGNGVRIAGEQVLLTGAVHLGADFTTPPEPGEVISGEDSTPTVPGAPFVPEPGVSFADVPVPGQLAAGIVRFKDSIESNLVIDPEFWAFIVAANTILTGAAALLALPWPYVDPPTKLAAAHTTASTTHTCNDPAV